VPVTAVDLTPLGIAKEAAAAAGRYRLAHGRQRNRGRLGSQRGHGVGSSQEFFDFRDYAPGDDLRHLDWRGYARTEQLRVRLHQEEVSPHVDVLVDTSASLASTGPKERAVRVLMVAVQHWARREGAPARFLALGGGVVDPGNLSFAGGGAPALPISPLRPGSVRVLLSDGLWQAQPTPFLQRAIAGASRFFAVLVLDPWELEPSAEGACTLVDCEDGSRAEVQLDARTIDRYRERLQRLHDGIAATVTGGGGTLAVVRAAALATMCSDHLLPAGIVEPA
jgi:hypothetical protein